MGLCSVLIFFGCGRDKSRGSSVRIATDEPSDSAGKLYVIHVRSGVAVGVPMAGTVISALAPSDRVWFKIAKASERNSDELAARR